MFVALIDAAVRTANTHRTLLETADQVHSMLPVVSRRLDRRAFHQLQIYPNEFVRIICCSCFSITGNTSEATDTSSLWGCGIPSSGCHAGQSASSPSVSANSGSVESDDQGTRSCCRCQWTARDRNGKDFQPNKTW